MNIAKVAVVGAGNMGSGIAQKIATESLPVILVDATAELAAAGKQRIEKLLMQALDRGIFAGDEVDAILDRVVVAPDLDAVADADLVIEAIYEDLEAKRSLFQRLGDIAKPDAILATNTSSFLVADLADVASNPRRVIGLHYFFHPAKNHLVEVIGHGGTDATVLDRAWRFQEQIGKTPIASVDAPGFVVNRFFVPWLNEAVRLYEEGLNIATIESVGKATFGIGMGPFELMNVTGVPIALHAARALADKLGDFYAPAPAIGLQVANGTPWPLEGDVDIKQGDVIADRLCGVAFQVALQLVSEGVSTIDDVDIGARVGLRWPTGPFQLMNTFGVEKTAELCSKIESQYGLEQPGLLREQLRRKGPFALRWVKLDIAQGIATITINRPDQLNALNPATVEQLGECFDQALADDAVRAIVIAGAGKAFVAGADVKFFVERIKSEEIGAIVDFAAGGQDLFKRIGGSRKKVICQLDGMALGGGAELALACQVIVATARGSLSFPETGIGIYPGLGGTQRLTQRVGKGLARYLIYTGATLRAKELEQLRLAWKVVEPADLPATIREAIDGAPVHQKADPTTMPAELRDLGTFLAAVPVDGLADGTMTLPGGAISLEVARKVRRKAINALVRVAELTEMAETGNIDAGLASETEGLRSLFAHPNALEGMTALLQGRRPKFNRY